MKKKKNRWVVGDWWMHPDAILFEVVELMEDGGAKLKMIFPCASPPLRQLKIPEHWIKLKGE